MASGTATTGTQIRKTCTVSSGIITVPHTNIYTTVDAQVPFPQSINLTAQIFNGGTPLPIYPFLQNGTSQSWLIYNNGETNIDFDSLTFLNQTSALAYPPQTYPTTQQMIDYVNSVIPDVGGAGFVFLSDYLSLADAVESLGSTRSTLLIDSIAEVDDDLTIPENITLFFTNAGGIQPADSKTVTIQGPITAPPFKIFYNCLDGQGSMSFVGDRRIVTFYPQWWGVVGDKDADDTLPLQACIDQIPNSSTVLFPANTRCSISSMSIDQRAMLTFTSEQAASAFGDNRSAGLFYRDVGGNMFNISASRRIAFTCLYLGNDNDVNGDVDRVLRWFGPPSTDINTQGYIQHCSINASSNASVANPDWIGIALGDSGDSQNCENFFIDDVDFAGANGGASQIAAHAGILTALSTTLNCVGAGFDSSMLGKKLWCSWADGILETTIDAIIDANNVTMADAAVTSESDVRVHVGNAVGVGIKNATTNGKQHVISRIRATWLDKGIWFTKGSFTLQKLGGFQNNIDLQVDEIAEASQASFIQTEQSLRGAVIGGTSNPLVLSFCRGANGNQLANGYYYFSVGGAILTVDHSAIEFDQPADNGVVFGFATTGVLRSTTLYSTQNNWAPHNGGTNTLQTMGFESFKGVAQDDTTEAGFVLSDGDVGIDDAPSIRYQFGGRLLTGETVLQGPIATDEPSFSLYTAQPHAVSAFQNEAKGFTVSTFASGNNASRKFVGFDMHSDNPDPDNFINGGNYVGHRYTLPTGFPGAPVVSAIGFHVRGALANTGITTAYGVKIEDLAAVTGVVNRRAFWQDGTTDLSGLKGLLAQGEGGVLSISSNTITPTNNIHHVGAGLIKTITVPSGFFSGVLCLIPDAAFTYDATDNIIGTGTATIGRVMVATYSSSSSKWYMSY